MVDLWPVRDTFPYILLILIHSIFISVGDKQVNKRKRMNAIWSKKIAFILRFSKSGTLILFITHKFHTKTDQNTNRTQIYIKSRSNGIQLWGLPCAVTNFDFDTEVNTNTYGNKRTSWFFFQNYLEDFYLHVLSGSVIKWKQNDKKCVNLNVFRLVMHTFLANSH